MIRLSRNPFPQKIGTLPFNMLCAACWGRGGREVGRQKGHDYLYYYLRNIHLPGLIINHAPRQKQNTLSSRAEWVRLLFFSMPSKAPVVTVVGCPHV